MDRMRILYQTARGLETALFRTQLFIVMDTKPKNGKTPLVKFKDIERGLFFYHERA